MLKRAFATLLVAALLVSGGAPRALLQGYAWASMIVSSSRALGLRKAAASALRGDAPCRLCLKAQQLRAGASPSMAASETASQDASQPRRSAAAPAPSLRALAVQPPLFARARAGFSSVEPQPPATRRS